MESNISQSFIPKESLARNPRRAAPTVGLFTLIAILVLLIAVVFLGGSYAYASYLRNQIEAPCEDTTITSTAGCGLRARLDRIRSGFQRELIEDFRRKDAKIRMAEEVLAEHNTVVPVFKLLEDLTLPSVRYEGANYSDDELVLTGRAKGYESIALQSDIFAASKDVESFLFSDLSPDALGSVSFRLSLAIKPAITSYQAYLDTLSS